MIKNDYEQLKELEESLWRPETRFDQEYMNGILSPDFFEFGRSGRTYTREQCLTTPPQEINIKFPFANFRVDFLESHFVLITYVSEVKYEQVEVANRSSLWIKIDKEWKLRFHQGTPVVK